MDKNETRVRESKVSALVFNKKLIKLFLQMLHDL